MIVRNIEIPIGTEIIVQDIHGNEIKAICKEGGNASSCLSCIFCGSKMCDTMFCQSNVRNDKKDVYFERIGENKH